MSQIARFFLIITTLGYLGAPQALGADALFGNLYKYSTITFGKIVPKIPLRPDGLRIFVWNIHKAVDPRLSADFADLAFGADISLFQESVSNNVFLRSLTTANPKLGWSMTKSFQQSDSSYTGVATGASVKPLQEKVIVSNITEPITKTPKTILLSEFAISNSTETLLVANIHGINFVSLESYKIQIHQLFDAIRSHHGPLIVAGDFNTWDPNRLIYLHKTFAPLGLVQVTTPIAGLLDLDHIFLRGLKPRFIFDFSYIHSSDHAPLMADLIYETTR